MSKSFEMFICIKIKTDADTEFQNNHNYLKHHHHKGLHVKSTHQMNDELVTKRKISRIVETFKGT